MTEQNNIDIREKPATVEQTIIIALLFSGRLSCILTNAEKRFDESSANKISICSDNNKQDPAPIPELKIITLQEQFVKQDCMQSFSE